MVYVSLLAISLVLTSGLGIYSWRDRITPGVTTFSLMMFVGTFWLLTITLMLLSSTQSSALFWYRASFISIATLPIFLLVFVAQYLQSQLITPFRLILITVVPVLTQFAVWTDDQFHLFFEAVSIAEKNGLMVLHSRTPSYWFYFHTIYSGIMLFASLAWLFVHAIAQFSIFRRQSIGFIAGVLVLAVPNFAFAIGLIPPDLIILPFCFILTCILFFWAIFYHRLLNLVPVVRSKMVDIMQDGMVVLDNGNRIVDINSTAKTTLSISNDDVIGQPAERVFEPWPVIVERFLNSHETQTEITIPSNRDELHFDVRITHLLDRENRAAGRLILFRDITERKEIERRQELQLEKLYGMALDANPMTGLPGNNSIAAAITRALNGAQHIGVVYTDLDNFKAFNDKYGFALGDDVIKFTAELLARSIAAADISNSFVGHIGGDDFVLLVPSEKMNQVAEFILAEFDIGVREFYSDDDLAQGYISSTNRKGEREDFPIMSISIAGVDLHQTHYKAYIDVNDACAELKKKSKTKPGSAYSVDLRVQHE